MKRIGISCLLLSHALSLAAQAPPPTPNPPDTAAMNKAMEKQEQQMKRFQEEQLELMKKMNPQLYKTQKAAMERREEIKKIVEDARAGKLRASAAEQELYPFVQQDCQDEIKGLKERIARLEKKLTFLREAKDNPDLLVQRRIKMLLGSLTTGQSAGGPPSAPQLPINPLDD